MTEPTQSNVELIAAVAIEARTRAVGWLVVIASFVGVYAIGTAVMAAGSAGSPVISALGLLTGMTATVAVIATLIPLARAAWTYRTAKAALVSEVNA